MLQLTKKEKAIIKSILTLLIFWYSAYLLQWIPVKIFHIPTNPISAKNSVILSTFSSFVLTIFFFFFYRKDLKKEFKIFKENLGENIGTGISCWLTGLFIMVVANLIIMYVFHVEGAKNENLVQDMIKALPSFMIIDAGILAPFNEEITFRKTIKDVFIKYKWIGIFVSFLLFGGAHVLNSATNWKDYLFIIPYGSLGAAFSYAYYKTDTIFTSMTMHIIHNVLLVLTSILL